MITNGLFQIANQEQNDGLQFCSLCKEEFGMLKWKVRLSGNLFTDMIASTPAKSAVEPSVSDVQRKLAGIMNVCPVLSKSRPNWLLNAIRAGAAKDPT